MKKSIIIVIVSFIGCLSIGQTIDNISLKDYEIISNDVIEIKESSFSLPLESKKLVQNSYTIFKFNNGGFRKYYEYNNLKGNTSKSEYLYNNDFSKYDFLYNDKKISFQVLKTPQRYFTAGKIEFEKNPDGSYKQVVLKGETADKDFGFDFTKANGITTLKSMGSFKLVQRFSEKGLLLSEENDYMSFIFSYNKSNFLSQKVTIMKKVVNYYTYVYEYDAKGNWIVRYAYSTMPSLGKLSNVIQGVTTRKITYKNNQVTGEDKLSEAQENKAMMMKSNIEINEIKSEQVADFPAFIDTDHYLKNLASNPNSKSTTSNCEGDCQNGWGKYTYENGSYTGFWKNGQKSGFGFYVWNDKSSYYGEWGNDKMTGFSQYTYPNGNQYFGNFLNSKFHGNGVLMTKETGKNEFNYYENGNVIRKLDYYDNNITKGCVTGNCQNGFGRYIFDNGTVYIGDFIDYKLVKGFMVFTNGDTYMGNFNTLSQFHGYGFYNYANNKGFYYGYWKNNKKEGKAYAVANDRFEIGEYLDNKFVKNLEQ